MREPQAVLTRDLVLIGGGHAHALILRMWGMAPLPGARLTVIDPAPVAAYSGMLPGFVAGHYARKALEIDLVKLCRFAGARLVIGAAVGLDAERREVRVAGAADERVIGYDVASVDVGIHTRMLEIAGFAEHGVAAKPLARFADAWADFVARVAAGEEAPRAAVIGGGLAGIELSMAMAHAMRQVAGGVEVHLIEAAAQITPASDAGRVKLERALVREGVTVLTGARIAALEAGAVRLEGGERLAAGFTVGAAGSRAHGWVAETGLPVTEDGFLKVGPDLRVEGREALFAAGDCAHMSHAPRVKAGVYAVRAAPVLRDNLLAALAGGAMREYHPQKHYLKLISLGGKRALAEKMGLAFEGAALWRWKDRIDRKFMAKLQELPVMAPPKAPKRVALGGDAEGEEMLCGGCGSKVAPGALAGVLAAQPAIGRKDVLSGPGDDAAVIETGGVRQVLTTDHLRAFTEDYGAMARIAALHALGDVWAMGAEPQAAMISVVLPRMSAELQARTLEEIMAEAGEALRAAGAEVVGGHSTMGAETTIGFALTGLIEGAAIGQGGARAGDALILTRGIGSGTLLAGEMRGLARGGDIARLMALLQRPQGDAAAILRGAHAMTDVTGFGLAGHLAAICRASGLGAEIALDAVPLLEGAEALAEAGVRSTIWAANREAAPVSGAGESARAVLLHDPQTAGGFLAAVVEEEAAALLDALRAAGHGAERIGRMVEGAGIRAV